MRPLPEEFLAPVERHRVTHTQVVPTMVVRLLRLPHTLDFRVELPRLPTGKLARGRLVDE